MNELLAKSKKIFNTPQNTIFSAAGIIMFMIIVSRVLGFIRQRVLFSFFPPEITDLYIASFELPDLMFEVFVTGMLSAAFIPVFSKYLNNKGKNIYNIFHSCFYFCWSNLSLFGRRGL